MPLTREQKKQLIELLLRVPPTSTFGGRTTLLGDAGFLGLNRDEANARVDLEDIVEQLAQLRADNALAMVIEKAVDYVRGTAVASELDALLQTLRSVPVSALVTGAVLPSRASGERGTRSPLEAVPSAGHPRMKRLVWKKRIGNGVIDCAVSPRSKTIVAGDVDGSVVTLDYQGAVQSTHAFELPVWGVDIDHGGTLLAVGLASKLPPKGEVVVLNLGQIVLREQIDCAVWDVRVVEGAPLVFASTWGRGLLACDYEHQKIQRFSFEDNLFGLTLSEDRRLLVTVSTEGLLSVDVNDPLRHEMVSRDGAACYKNAVSPKTRKAFYGSSRGVLSVVNLDSGQEHHYRTAMGQICGMTAFGDYLFYGDLDGNLASCHAEHPGMPLSRDQMSGGIWSIASDEANSLLFVACGNGDLCCYEVSGAALDTADASWSASRGVIDYAALVGAKIFICYASEDASSALALYDALKTAGCDAWIDRRDLLPGQNWKHEIAKTLQQTDFVVVCLSTRSVSKKGFVQKEIRAAMEALELMPEERIFLIPVRVDDCTVPSSLADRHWVDLFSDDGFHKLLLSICVERLKR